MTRLLSGKQTDRTLIISMEPIPQVIQQLKADANVTAVVGQNIFADNPPQNNGLPIVVLAIGNTEVFGTVQLCNLKLYSADMTVDIICKTRRASEEAQFAIEDSIIGYSSNDPEFVIESIVHSTGTSWQVLEAIDGSDERGYWCSQTFTINFRRN